MQGDAVATRILERAAEELVLAARSVTSRLEMRGEAFGFHLAGGVFRVVPWLVAELSRRLVEVAPRSRVSILDVEPAVGAVRLALAEARGGARIPRSRVRRACESESFQLRRQSLDPRVRADHPGSYHRSCVVTCSITSRSPPVEDVCSIVSLMTHEAARPEAPGLADLQHLLQARLDVLADRVADEVVRASQAGERLRVGEPGSSASRSPPSRSSARGAAACRPRRSRAR